MKMSDALPEISETCRCGSSTKLVGEMATDDRLKAWRDGHRCMLPDEARFLDLPQPSGAGGSMVGFRAQWDHDDRPPVR
jgi:hypothetical protein